MRPLVLSVLLVLPAATPLRAQTLQEDLTSLFVFGDCGTPLCLDVDPAVHGSHFIEAIQTGGANVLSFVTNAIGVTVANAPVSAATSGAVWGKSEAGLPVRTATSAGPVFTERVQTLGKGHALIGVNASFFDFTTIRGVPLNDLSFNFTHEDENGDGLGNPLFENDIIAVRTDLNVNLVTITGVLTYGLLDGLDLGVAVPFVHTSISGLSQATITPFDNTIPHRFGTEANPSLTATADANGSATGLGDVAARLKARIAQGERFGFGVLGEVRFPTGKEEDLLGTGEYSARGLGIVSARYGDFSPHANVGYRYRGGEFQNDAFLAAVGFDHLLAGWATLAADIISEWQVGDAKLLQPEPVVINTPVGTGTSARVVLPSNIPERRDDFVLGSLGFKFTSESGITVVTNALIPVRRGYLQPDVALTAGLEYSF